jgi:hypothetical protein
MAGSSPELRAFAEDYARSVGAKLNAHGANVGLEAYIQRVAADPAAIGLVVSSWPLAGRTDVRVIPIRPAPQYPWYAVWRTGSHHQSLRRVLRGLRDG